VVYFTLEPSLNVF